MKKLVYILLSFLFYSSIQAQYNLKPDEFIFKLTNGLNVFYIKDTTEDKNIVNLTFDSGIYSQNDEMLGSIEFYNKLLAVVFAEKLKNDEAILIDHYVKQTSNSFIFSVNPSKLNSFFITISQCLTNPELNITLLQKIRHELKEENLNRTKSSQSQIQELVSKQLWGSYFIHRNQYKIITEIDSNFLWEAIEFCQTYFCPDHAIIAICGNYTPSQIRQLTQDNLTDWSYCNVKYLNTYHLPKTRDYRISSQTVSFIKNNNPCIIKSFKGPSIIENKQQAFASTYLQHIFNYSELKKILNDSFNISSVKVYNAIGLYSSEIQFIILLDSINTNLSLYKALELLKPKTRQLIFNESIINNAIQSYTTQCKKAFESPSNRLATVGLLWAIGGINLYNNYESLHKEVNPAIIYKLLDDYIYNKPYNSSFLISQNKYIFESTDTLYTTTKKHLIDYKFYFKKNSTEFSDTNQLNNLKSLVEFLKINPQLKIQVNGVASSTEYLTLRNEMRQYIETLDDFIIHPKKLVTEKNIRLDIYRSLTIIKYLKESGIDQSRLKGFGRLDREGEGQKYQKAFISEFIY